VRVGEETRAYLLDIPAGPSDEPRPVLLAFHSAQGSAGRLRRRTGLGPMSRRRGFIAAFPQGRDGVELRGTTGRGWDSGLGDTRDLRFVTTLLDTLERDWCVDRRRVYATGMSSGGVFTNLLGCLLPDRLAAIAPVAGSGPLSGCRAPRPLPVLLIHGANDRMIPPAMARSARDWWMKVNGCRSSRREKHCQFAEGCAAEVTYCEAGQGHRWPRPATRRIVGFFETHVRE
jgi:polyhydroxybutyrate depolymerase